MGIDLRTNASLLVGGLLLGWPAAGTAQASYSVETIGSVRHDTNIFRRSDDAPASASGRCRSDTVGRLQSRLTGLYDDGTWSANLSGGPYRELYRCNDYLDFTGYEVFGAIRRRNDGPLIASLNVIALRQRSAFADIRTEAGNIQNFVRTTGEFGLAVTPELRVVVDPRFVASTNSNALFRGADYHSYGGSVGLGWFTPLDNSIAFKLSRNVTKGLGSRLVRLDDQDLVSPIDLADTAFGAELTYHPSVLTTVEASLFYVRRRDRSVLRQNYNGLTGSVRVHYQPHDLLTVTAEAGRRLSNENFLFIDAVRDDYASASIERKLSTQSKVTARFDYDKQNYRFNLISDTARPESFRRMSAELTADTLVYDTIAVKGSVRREWGDGTVSYPKYAATIVSLQLSYKFGNAR